MAKFVGLGIKIIGDLNKHKNKDDIKLRGIKGMIKPGKRALKGDSSLRI